MPATTPYHQRNPSSTPAASASPELPNAVEAERALLGCLLLSESKAGDLIGIFPTEALQDPTRQDLGTGSIPVFFKFEHQLIFRAIVSVWKKTGLTSLPLVAQELHERRQLELAGGAAAVAGFEDDVFALSQGPRLAEIIVEKWRGRCELAILDEIRSRRLAGDSAAELYRRLDELKASGGPAKEEPALDGPNLADFILTPRPPLQYLIEGILPRQGKLTISAPAKAHKTFFLQELGLCMASSPCEWLGMRFCGPFRVGLVQPELSDALLAQRSAWIVSDPPSWLDIDTAMQNFFVYETDHGRPNIADGMDRIKRFIERRELDVVLFDSLYMLTPGLSENDANEMAVALDRLARLTVDHGVSLVLTHHHGKNGQTRGSSVFQGWPETDLSMSPVEQDRGVLKVEGLFRCCFGTGFPAYWLRPTRENAWFEAMPLDWAPEKPGRKSKVSPSLVTMVFKGASPLRFGDAVKSIMDAASCSKSRAAEALADAVATGVIIKGAGVYTLPLVK